MHRMNEIRLRIAIMSTSLYSTLLCLLCCIGIVEAFHVYVPGKAEQCFFDHVYKGDKVVGSYFVREGGNLDIDLRLTGPDGKVIYEKERTQDGSFQFKAMQEGTHTLCFDNRMSTVTGKSVSFNLYVGDALHKKDAASAQSLSPLENAVLKTSDGLHGMKDTISYFKGREIRHAQTVDSTNGRVLFWNAVNVGTLILVGLSQVFIIRSMFETKRKA